MTTSHLPAITPTARSTRVSAAATALSSPPSAPGSIAARAWRCKPMARSWWRATAAMAPTMTSLWSGTTSTGPSTRVSAAAASSPPTSAPETTSPTASRSRLTAGSWWPAIQTPAQATISPWSGTTQTAHSMPVSVVATASPPLPIKREQTKPTSLNCRPTARFSSPVMAGSAAPTTSRWCASTPTARSTPASAAATALPPRRSARPATKP